MSISTVKYFECMSCGEEHDPNLSDYPCPICGGFLDPTYDFQNSDISKDALDDSQNSIWRYKKLLPVREEGSIASLGEGLTPLLECDTIAETYGFGTLLVKDEGQNPTSTFKDRGASVTMSGFAERGITDACITTVGNAGHAAAAYASRAGINCHIYLTSDRGELATTLMQAHGADIHLGEDFVTIKAQMEAASEEHGWASLSPFSMPFRHEGKKTMGLELFEQLGWTTPDHVVYPTGGGVGVIGIWKAFQHYADLGWLDTDEPPTMNVVQTTGCAPLVKALEEGWDRHEPWSSPDSIARGVMNPDPGGSEWILDIVRESNGTGVAVSDREAVEASLDVMRMEGIEMGITSAVALAGAKQLREDDHIKPDDEVVVVNTGAAGKSASELKQHLPPLT